MTGLAPTKIPAIWRGRHIQQSAVAFLSTKPRTYSAPQPAGRVASVAGDSCYLRVSLLFRTIVTPSQAAGTFNYALQSPPTMSKPHLPPPSRFVILYCSFISDVSARPWLPAVAVLALILYSLREGRQRTRTGTGTYCASGRALLEGSL